MDSAEIEMQLKVQGVGLQYHRGLLILFSGGSPFGQNVDFCSRESSLPSRNSRELAIKQQINC